MEGGGALRPARLHRRGAAARGCVPNERLPVLGSTLMLGATKRLELPRGGRAMALQSIARNHAMQLQSSARSHAQPCIAAVPGSHFITASCCHAGEELADVLLYLVRLSDACGIDLAAAAEAKLRKNAGKRQQRCAGPHASTEPTVLYLAILCGLLAWTEQF